MHSVEQARNSECIEFHQHDEVANVQRHRFGRHQQLLPLLQVRFLEVTKVSLAKSKRDRPQHRLQCAGRRRHHRHLLTLI